MAGKKITEPFGLVTQREWDGLIARGADLAHIGMFALLRVRSDPDGVTRDGIAALASRMNRSDDTAERLLKWLRDEGVVWWKRTSVKGGTRGVAWRVLHRALPLEEWKVTPDVPTSPEETRMDAPLFLKKRPANGGEETRKSARRDPHPLGDNPEVPQTESQTDRPASSLEELEEDGVLDEVLTILMASPHAAAFKGKAFALGGVIASHPDKDAVQTAHAIADRFKGKIVDGPALFKTWLVKAADVDPPEQFVCRDHERIFTDHCSEDCGSYRSIAGFKPGGMYHDEEQWARILANSPRFAAQYSSAVDLESERIG